MRVNKEGEGLSSEGSETTPRFPTVRKGLDQREVYPYIERLRLQIEGLQRQNELLKDEVGELRRQVENPVLDIDKVTEVFGKQASEILRSAHDIGSSIRKRAELNARDIVSRAEREATDLELQASVSAEAQMTEAAERAKEIVERAKSEAAEIITLAEQGAQSISERAKSEGRSLLHRARELRSKVFNEMQTRIELLNGDIEELETSRGSLLQMLGAAETVLSEVRNDILGRDREGSVEDGDSQDFVGDHNSKSSMKFTSIDTGVNDGKELDPAEKVLAADDLPSAELLGTIIGSSKEPLVDDFRDGVGEGESHSEGSYDNADSAYLPTSEDQQMDQGDSSDVILTLVGNEDSEFEGVVSVRPLNNETQPPQITDEEMLTQTKGYVSTRDKPGSGFPSTSEPSTLSPESNVEVEEREEETTEFQVVVDASREADDGDNSDNNLPGDDDFTRDSTFGSFTSLARDDNVELEEPRESEPGALELDQLEKLFERLKDGRDRETKAAFEEIAVHAPSSNEEVKIDSSDSGYGEGSRLSSQVDSNQFGIEDELEPESKVGLIERRDEELADIVLQMSRRVKRILQDDQNDLLDVLRKGGIEELLKRVAELLSNFEHHGDALHPYLDQSRRVGAQFFVEWEDSTGTPSFALQRVGEELLSLISELSLKRISALYSSLESGESLGQVSLINSVYRDLRVQKVDEIVGDYINSAFNVGVREIPGVINFNWTTFDLGGNCSDCDDNALANPNPKDEDFPTGHRIPPVHPGCRCMIIPIIA